MGLFSSIRDRFARNDPANTVAGVFPKWQANKPLWDRYDFRLMADEGYRRNVVIYGCVRAISDSTAEPRVVVRQRQPDGKFKDVPSDHPLVLLLSEPNPDQSWFEFAEQLVTHLEVAGNAYILKLRSMVGRVVRLVLLRPDRVKIIPDEFGQVAAYRFGYGEGEWRTIPENDVVHLKLPDPLDDFYGMSPIVVAAGVADMDTNGVDYLRAFFLNSGEPSGILTFKGRVEAENRQRVKEMWRDQHGMNTGFSGGWGGLRSLFAGAVGGWHSISVMDSDVSYQEIGSRPGKLGLDNIFGLTESRQCAAFGVPAIVVGVKIGLDRSTFANYETAVKAFWSQTLRPMYGRIGDKLTVGLAREFGPQLRIAFDLEHVEALQESQESKRTYAIEGWNSGLLMQNEARMLTGQEALEGGDIFKELNTVVLDPAGGALPEQQRLRRRLVKLFRGALAPNGHVITVEPSKKNGNGNGNGHHHAIAGPVETHDESEPAWKTLHRIADSAAPELKSSMLKALAGLSTAAVRRKVETALTAGDLDAAVAAIPWEKIKTGKLSSQMQDQLQSIAEKAGVASEKIQPPELEISFDLKNPMAAQWAKDHAGALITGISDESLAAVRGILAKGMDAGTDPGDLADQLADYVGLTDRDAGAVQNLRDSLTKAGELSPDEIDAKVTDYAEELLDARAELIARTESITAANTGQQMLWQQAVDADLLDTDQWEQVWIATEDDQSCEDCMDLDETTAPIGEQFSSPNFGDVDGPTLHPACRCAVGLQKAGT